MPNPFDGPEGFRYPRGEWLGEVLYRDLATLPDGYLVDALRGSHDLLDVDGRFARYELSWRHQDPRDWGDALATMTVAEALEAAGRYDPTVTVIEALTRYRVTVRLDDRSRSYVAAFAWLDRTGDRWEFLVLDHVTQGVDRAAAEKLPTLAELERAGKDAASQPITRITAASTTKSCKQESTSYGSGQGHAGANGHESGAHRAGAGHTRQKRPTSTVTSFCSGTTRSSAMGTGDSPERTRSGTTSGSGAMGITTGSRNPTS